MWRLLSIIIVLCLPPRDSLVGPVMKSKPSAKKAYWEQQMGHATNMLLGEEIFPGSNHDAMAK